MSPEQVRGQPADQRSDIFAFGAVLYEMLQGSRPFTGESSVETMNAILTQEPPPLARVPPVLEEIVRHCLEKEPGERFQSARDLGFQLRLARHPSAQVQALPPAGRTRGWLAVAALLVVLVGTVAGLLWWRERQGAPPSTLVITRLTWDSGLTTDATLSPDGTFVAYASDRSGEGNLDVWLQQVGKSEAIRLTFDPADEREPAFSPDGTRIAFRSERDGGGVYVVSTLGGAATRIAPGGRRPRFSPDGTRIAYWVGSIGREIIGGSRTYLVGASGGSPTRVASDFAIARHPLWTPDGRHLLFTGSREPIESFAESQARWEWWVWPLEGAAPMRTGALEVLSSLGLGIPVPAAWDREGGILFAAQLGDTRNIWQLRLSHDDWRVVGEPRQLTSGTGMEDLPAASAGRVVFSSFTENADIWSVRVDTRRGVVTGPLERLTENAAVDVQPSISGDGRRVAFTSNRAGNYDVFTKDLERGDEVPVTISAPSRIRSPACCRGVRRHHASGVAASPSAFTGRA